MKNLDLHGVRHDDVERLVENLVLLNDSWKIICVNSDKIMLVIKYPLITKKTSTPTKPPENRLISRWNNTTTRTDMPLRPSMSVRNPSPGSGHSSERRVVRVYITN